MFRDYALEILIAEQDIAIIDDDKETVEEIDIIKQMLIDIDSPEAQLEGVSKMALPERWTDDLEFDVTSQWPPILMPVKLQALQIPFKIKTNIIENVSLLINSIFLENYT